MDSWRRLRRRLHQHRHVDGAGYARKGVVLVSLGYRLGPYGFMAHPELSRESGHGSGTYGIEDLVAGLQWVHANVAAFGGDPGNVTIFGHSAGSAAVSFLAATPRTKGLFHRVIAMSGASFAPLVSSEQGGFRHEYSGPHDGRGNRQRLPVQARRKNIAEARASVRTRSSPPRGAAWHSDRWPTAMCCRMTCPPCTRKAKFNDTPVLLGHTSDETLAFGGSKSVTPADFEKQTQEQFGAQAEAVLSAYPHATDADAVRASRHVRNDTSFGWNM